MSITIAYSHGTTRVAGVINKACCVDPGQGWYVFFVGDCFDPPMYLVRGENFSDAYDWFLTEKESLIALDEFALIEHRVPLQSGDMIDGITTNDNGTPVWSDSVCGHPVTSSQIDWFAPAAT